MLWKENGSVAFYKIGWEALDFLGGIGVVLLVL